MMVSKANLRVILPCSTLKLQQWPYIVKKSDKLNMAGNGKKVNHE